MKYLDHTPAPVEVDTPDSKPGLSLEVKKGQELTKNRRRFGKALLAGSAFAMVLGGQQVADEAVNHDIRERKGAVAALTEAEYLTADKKVASNHETPAALMQAHNRVAGRFFGFGSKGVEKATAFADRAAFELNKSEQDDWGLDVSEFVDTDRFEISEDGKSFKLDGKSIRLIRASDADKNVYVMGAQTMRDEEGHLKAVAPRFVGAEKYEEGMEADEIRKRAEDNARINLNRSLTGRIISDNGTLAAYIEEKPNQ